MKKSILIAFLLTCFISVNAQNSSVRITETGSSFEFKNGVTEWSEPLVCTLRGSGKKGVEIQADISMRIRVKKRMMMACHYEVEITNLSETKSVSFEYGNRYTDATNKRIWHGVKLKPKSLTTGKILFAELGFKPKEVENCTECFWHFEYANLKVK